jgi:transcriptional regulator with XRE-family HTH domain
MVAIGKTSDMQKPTQRRGAQQLFATNMRRIRLERKLTQEKVAEAAGLHPNYISSVERGERNISIGNIENIAFALGVSMSDLVADSQPTEKKKISQGKTS